ncbi:MAG TPA: hypothetical protein VMC07_00190 [Candidatus Omnitrophota bacterium]|nr:hypothetical protein [Candidatus Omnitrophota bacterium]
MAIIEMITYFALGIIGDILVTLYYLFIGKSQGLLAASMSLLITLLNFFVIGRVVVSNDWILMLIYALGGALGCFGIIAFQKSKLKKKFLKKKRNAGKRK